MHTSPRTLRPQLTDQVSGIAALLTTCALWGLVFVAPVVVPDVPPVLLAGVRYLLHGLACLVLLQRVGAPTDTALWGRAALHGATGFVGYYILLTLAVRTGGPTLVVLVMAASPVVYLLAGRPGVALRRLALPMLTLVGGGVLAGATAEGPLRHLTPGSVAGAVVLVAAAVAIWTWYGLDNARIVADPDLDLTRWTAMTGVAAGLLSLPLVAFGLTQTATPRTLLTPTAIGVLLVLALACTTVANRTWNVGSRRVAPSVVGPLLVFETIFALTYAHLLEGRAPSAVTLSGEALLVLGAGACLLVLRRRQAPVDRADELSGGVVVT